MAHAEITFSIAFRKVAIVGKESVATIDFESRSECSLRNSGSWKYSLDPSTEILCLAFRLPYWAKGRTGLWHPAFPNPGIKEGGSISDLGALLEWIDAEEPIEAHNAFFERGIWTNILAPKYGWPTIISSQWRCSAAKASAHALPRGLDDALAAMKLAIRKDDVGIKTMKKVSKPRKPRKAEREAWALEHGDSSHPTLYFEDKELLEGLWAYCRQDVLAEENFSLAIPDLSPDELSMYHMDQAVNERGFQIDQEAVGTALTLIGRETTALNAELAKLTGGKVQKATQRAQMMAWFEGQGWPLPNTQKATIEIMLGQKPDMLGETQDTSKMPRLVKRSLQIVRALGRSSTAKYKTMKLWSCPDGRVRGGLLYHGASTGRWTGAGVQPHNFVRGSVKDMELTWDVLKTLDRKKIVEIGDVMETLSHALRGAITATPGKRLYVADYSSIEARVLFWLAGDSDALDIFRRHEDIYAEMASSIYRKKIAKEDPERQLGKAAILGLGYQMGASKFVATALTYGVTIDEDFSKGVVDQYRSKFWKVKQLWIDQERTAIAAVSTKQKQTCNGISWLVDGAFLYAILPSGRRLSYPHPKIKMKATPWGEKRPVLTFMGYEATIRQWIRQTTYGGKIVENLVQAIARDLMAYAMLRCERSKIYSPVLSVHDEMLAEADEGKGDIKEFERLMAKCPPWATDCPVTAEGWTGFRYRK